MGAGGERLLFADRSNPHIHRCSIGSLQFVQFLLRVRHKFLPNGGRSFTAAASTKKDTGRGYPSEAILRLPGWIGSARFPDGDLEHRSNRRLRGKPPPSSPDPGTPDGGTADGLMALIRRATLSGDIEMKAKLAVASLLVLGYVLPASAESFYIVREGDAKHCSVVSQKPIVKTTTVVNPDGTTYTTQTEAETAMKTIKVCNE
jgi:hypothetical protein